jgi:hypothetical protein
MTIKHKLIAESGKYLYAVDWNDDHVDSGHKDTHKTGGSDPFTVSDLLDALARLNLLKAGASVGSRRGLNLIEGSNITLTVSDDPTNEKVDVTITGSGGGGGISKTRTFITLFPVGVWSKGTASANYVLQSNSASYQIPLVNIYLGQNNETDEMVAQEFDPTKYSDISAVYFEAWIGCRSSGKTAYIELWDYTNNVAITGSELTNNTQTMTRKRSGDIKDNFSASSAFIGLRIKGSDTVENEFSRAQIIIDQNSS